MSETSSTRGEMHLETAHATAAREEAAARPNIIEALHEVDRQLARAKPSRDCEARILGSRDVREPHGGRRHLLLLAGAMSLVVTGLVVRRTTEERGLPRAPEAGSSEATSEGANAAAEGEGRGADAPSRAPQQLDRDPLGNEGEARPTHRELPQETLRRPLQSPKPPQSEIDDDGASVQPTPTSRSVPLRAPNDSRDRSPNRTSRRGATMPRVAVLAAPNGGAQSSGDRRGALNAEPGVERDESKNGVPSADSAIPEREGQDGETPERPIPEPEDDLACDGLEGLGSYSGYFCSFGSDPSFQADAISCADALADCEQSSLSSPSMSVMCTWNGVVIFMHEASPGACEDPSAQPVCGLFRGGLSEAENMIASPDPADSIDDSDEACIAYCEASSPEPGDVCARGGSVIKTY